MAIKIINVSLKQLNIRTRLAMQFALIIASLLIIFSISIYSFSESYHKSEFYKRLKDKALTTARLLIEVKEVDHDLLKVIDRNAINAMYNEKVVIYDYKNQQIYNSLDDDTIHISKQLLDKIRLQTEIRYVENQYQVVGLLYTDRFNRFVVLASAEDKYGNSKLNNLKWILFIGFFLSTAFAIFISRIYAGRALTPISNVLKQVDNISVANLDMRVQEGNGTDEIAQLAITFNKMLNRLELAFKAQRNFVANASHELRTPLTSIKGNIEVSLMNQREKQEYQETLKSVLEDTENLIELSNRLLDLAKASSDVSAISIQGLRIDELLWDTIAIVKASKSDYKMTIQFDDQIDNEEKFMVEGNEYLLKATILNLIDNACKYSADKSVTISLSIEQSHLCILFADKGIGISSEELKSIFEPFYRATNAKNISGHGLGLSLSEKIIHIHNGSISIDSALHQGTTVKVLLPLISKPMVGGLQSIKSVHQHETLNG